MLDSIDLRQRNASGAVGMTKRDGSLSAEHGVGASSPAFDAFCCIGVGLGVPINSVVPVRPVRGVVNIASKEDR